MIDRNNNYRWILLQSPLQYRNEKKEIESSLVVIYDLLIFILLISHYFPLWISIIMKFSISNILSRIFSRLKLRNPIITKREKEILKLMARV
jgi:hypothetical protein